MAGSSFVVDWLGTSALALAAAAPAWTSLRSLHSDADAARVEERAEHAVRVCARLAAARRNLADAASWIAERQSQLAPRARRLADRASQRLEDAYPHDATEKREGTCEHASTHLAATIHQERTPGRPATWPNWVVTFQTVDR